MPGRRKVTLRVRPGAYRGNSKGWPTNREKATKEGIEIGEIDGAAYWVWRLRGALVGLILLLHFGVPGAMGAGYRMPDRFEPDDHAGIVAIAADNRILGVGEFHFGRAEWRLGESRGTASQ